MTYIYTFTLTLTHHKPQAYRPCPSAVDAGYGYKRKGQDFSEFIAGERRKKIGDEEEELKEF